MRDNNIIALIFALGLVAGLTIGWQFGWRVGAREGTDRLLCLTASIGSDHFKDETRKYCARIGSPIASDLVHNAEPHAPALSGQED